MQNRQEFEHRCRASGASIATWVKDILAGRLPLSYRAMKYLPKCLVSAMSEDTGRTLNWLLEPVGIIAIRQRDRVMLVDVTQHSVDLRTVWHMTAEESWRSAQTRAAGKGGAA
ncbi:MAG: hypothetical protein DYG92_02245 [Leptolyngbya sp. PLA1]|nr:hypothetical protein [Leptolyngbya sp. PLA1]